MNEIISQLKTPEDCIKFAERSISLAQEAYRRAIELRAAAHLAMNDLEKELWKVIYAYEEVLTKKNKRRTLASRTRQMIIRHGIIGAAERAVNRKIEAMGYKLLVDMGLQDLTFEAVIIRFPKAFAQSIVKLCEERLEELKRL